MMTHALSSSEKSFQYRTLSNCGMEPARTMNAWKRLLSSSGGGRPLISYTFVMTYDLELITLC
jgi:hypothetical protein